MRRIVTISIVMLCTAVVAHAFVNEQRVMGTVTAMSSNSITVQSAADVSKTITVTVVPSTKFLKSGMDASMTDLKVGDRAVFHAKLVGEKLEAAIVRFGKPHNAYVTPVSYKEQRVMGTVTAMSPSSMTVQTATDVPKTITVTVVPSTKYLKSRADASIADLKVHDRVVVHGKLINGKLEAATVMFGKPPVTK